MTRAEVLTELELLGALPARLPDMTGFFALFRSLADLLDTPPSVITLTSASDLNRVRGGAADRVG